MSIVKVFSISIGNRVAKLVSIDLKINFIYNIYSYRMNKILHLNFCCIFLPKKSKTIYSGHLVIANTFFRNPGVRYRQVLLYIIGKTCFDLCFLFHVITGRHYFLHKFSRTRRFGVFPMLLRPLTQVYWNRSAFCIRYLQSNTATRPFTAANTKGSK